ncbi:MAG: hypothetical protein HQK83_00745 [Fibrobacteria bacterium]|nr:hypothetical protein [Fibrobacteria bacterium]
MRVLIIGGGDLGKSLAMYFRPEFPVDVITRSLQKKSFFENLGCGLFARNISNSDFSFAMNQYELVILCAAVTVDVKVKTASRRLFVNGTKNIIHQLQKTKFKGKLVIVGSAEAVPDPWLLLRRPASGVNAPEKFIDEQAFSKLQHPQPDPAFLQFDFWKNEQASFCFTSVFLLCGHLYGPQKNPARKLVQGLRVTTQNPCQWVNLVHIDDVVKAVIFTSHKNVPSDFFFITDRHPFSLEEYYGMVTREHKLPAVSFVRSNSRHHFLVGNKIDNKKITKRGFTFEHSFYTGLKNA